MQLTNSVKHGGSKIPLNLEGIKIMNKRSLGKSRARCGRQGSSKSGYRYRKSVCEKKNNRKGCVIKQCTLVKMENKMNNAFVSVTTWSKAESDACQSALHTKIWLLFSTFKIYSL